MSTSDLYILNGKSTTHFAEFRNGHGSAPICWDFIGTKYIDEKPIYSMDHGYLKKVWALASTDKLTHPEATAMLMTFDRAYVPMDCLEEAADGCIRFGEMCEDGRRENHWPEIGEKLREAASMKHNRHARGIALSCTSVSDAWSWPSDEQLSCAWPTHSNNA
tara:strand:+ start:421 stop:906 length:486 start_codon:yes stop_codon:yes gene_type:complete